MPERIGIFQDNRTETQREGVSLGGGSAGRVEVVTDHRTTRSCQMQTNLVSSTGHGAGFDKGAALSAADQGETSFGRLSPLIHLHFTSLSGIGREP